MQESIAALMERSGVRFGTSGARGRVEAMTDRVCYSYTRAFLEHMHQSGQLPAGGGVLLAGDLRASTDRIMAAVGRAISDAGYRVQNAGKIPTPALAAYAFGAGMPSIMVTGSHIPDDRNGIKFNTPSGEILKSDEAAIRALSVDVPEAAFDPSGRLARPYALPTPDPTVAEAYVRRYLEFFPEGCLAGRRIGLYEHSSVARDLLRRILTGLGAEVVSLGRSERFVPVDTEAIRPEDIELASRWAREHALHAIISTDGDGDRPLVSDEQGNWLRGDVAGILCARYLQADTVVTPVSSNTAAERSGFFQQVLRTRIGSPYVIEKMALQGREAGTVVGFEANGGFLTATTIRRDGRELPPLPTRDAVIVPLALLELSRSERKTVSALLRDLPPRYTASNRLTAVPTASSQALIGELWRGDGDRTDRLEALFGPISGPVAGVDTVDGLRITFENGEIIHLRPSGNAPELRCYNEADSAERARELNANCLALLREAVEGTEETRGEIRETRS